MAKNLKQIMKNLALESADEIFLKISSDKIKKASSFVFVPEFNEAGICNNVKKKKSMNFKMIVYDNEQNLSELSSFKIATNFLKTIIRKKHDAYDKKLVVDFESVVRKIILDFLTHYLSYLNFKKSDSKPFDISYRIFSNYLNNELFTVFCFTTLRNFDSKRSSLLLPNNQILRLRTPEEFLTICNIKDAKSMPKINTNFQKIKYIIGTHIPRTSISDEKIKERFEKFLFALKIFHHGDVQFGGIYYKESENWEVKPTICISSEPVLSKPKIKYSLETESFSEKDFKKFLNDFSKINLTKGKHVFLGRSIKRFSQSLENENTLDRIVDFIICLESLYSSNEQQLSFRFAMRVAIVLGQTPRQKLMLQEFILQIYDLRSKIVHGDELPKIELDGKEIDLNYCIENLEKIARNSIHIFLDLINDFDTKEELHKMIDKSIYNPSLQRSFPKLLKKLKISGIDLSQK